MHFLIMSVTAGEGHNSTAKAIREELLKLGAECTVLDTFKYVSPTLAKIISDGYLLVTENGSQRRMLKPGQEPNVVFHLAGEKPLAVYAYCNLHGLWKTELN